MMEGSSVLVCGRNLEIKEIRYRDGYGDGNVWRLYGHRKLQFLRCKFGYWSYKI